MEPIGEILERINPPDGPGQSPRMTLNGERKLGAPLKALESCNYCHGAKFVYNDVPLGDPDFGKIKPCLCLQAELVSGQYKRMLAFCEVPSALQDRTFGLFLPRRGTGPGIEAAKALAYKEAEFKFLTLIGKPGCGKTHLAIACVLARLRMNKLAKYIYVPDFLDSLRASFKPEAEITYEDLIRRYREVPLLCLDDLGAEAPTRWVAEKLDQLIDYRYRNALDTVVTTNLLVGELPARIQDRLCDTRLGRVVVLNAMSYRLEKGPTGATPRLKTKGGYHGTGNRPGAGRGLTAD